MSLRMLFIHALSPVHAGTGQSVGAIDLAIARDRATGVPVLPGTSIKGSLRAHAKSIGKDKEFIWRIFGPDTANASEHAGCIAIADANLLLLPVRSIGGTFAWVTSPYLLARFARDCAEAKVDGFSLKNQRMPQGVKSCVISGTSALEVPRKKGDAVANEVIFEDLNLVPEKGATSDDLAKFIGQCVFPGDTFWQNSLRDRLCIVQDDVMSFLSQHATDIVARVKLKDNTKTVENLWHEESLPTESILVSLVAAVPNAKIEKDANGLLSDFAEIAQGSIQFGGKATVGRGRCRVIFCKDDVR